MDPNENLKRQLELAKKILNASDDQDINISEAADLAELVLAL